ncbi:uncharacterized protein LOC135201025 isoform X2 [Macrobrachium nipponense]|uniref:uncharacterized protein LOC135201025 isoform X2 n=1 Tax=Macrobrachium nipponense TaxID=159736 RepID=UPI0030C7F340
MRCWKYLLSVVLSVLLGNQCETAAKEQACVISSGIVQIPWVWPQVLVTSWVPPRNGSDRDPVLLEFKVDFVDDISDVLLLRSNNVTILTQNDDRVSADAQVYPNENGWGGWLSVTFEVKDTYVLRRTDSDEVVFSAELGNPTAHVREVVITGSNVTVNCDSDELIWHVFRGKKTVPLTPGGRGWRVGILPTSEVLPTLTLDGSATNLTLGLSAGRKGISANTSVPLEPFTRYSFVIECLSSTEPGEDTSLNCYVKAKKSLLKAFKLPLMPRFLEIEGESIKPFYFIQNIVPLPVIVPVIDTTPAQSGSHSSASSPASGGGGSGGGSHGSGGQVKLGWSGWWAALAVILGCILIFVIIMCFVSHYHRPKIELDPIWYTRKMSKRYLETMNLISEASQEHLESSPVPERRPLLARSCSVVVNVEDPKMTKTCNLRFIGDESTCNPKWLGINIPVQAPLRLWNAVSSGEIEEVEQVLATMTPDPEIMLQGWDTSPYEEAHRRGHHHILKVLDAFMSRQPQIPDNDMIISVMQAHARNVEALFEAARGGQYRHGGGVDVLLRSFSLPGTVRDQQGQSLLHYAASVKLADGGPLWLAPDIRSLVENHKVYVNAVDYKGQTALHALAEKASMSDQITCWDGKAVYVSQAWVNLATLIMKLGCDPRLPDNSNRSPSEVAQINGNIPLADEFEKERAKLGPSNFSKYLDRFKDFLEASKMGKVNDMQELLREGVSVLPIGSRSDPLQEAIKGGHRDAVFLLLSAGAPLCAHGLVGDTPYEAAHSTPGLPALFPALIRKALCGQLEVETNIIRGSNEIPELLKKGSKDIKTIIEKSGHKLASELGKWMDEQPAYSLHNFNEMLATASSLGLTLTCQLMGVAGVRLNPLPSEQQPLLLAINNNQHNTVYSLCRDLKMNPYIIGVTEDEISQQLKNDLLQSELLIFEKKLHKAAFDEVTVGNLMNDANGISEKGSIKNPSKMFLYLLAELSLVTLLHRTRKFSDDSLLDTIVNDATGSTMLHIAAAYGRINMIEYLLSVGADHTCKTKDGLTAPHLAAARGHKKCMEYIIDYTKHHEKWNSVLPQQVLNSFEENMKSYHLDVLSTSDLDAISSAKDDFTKTQIILASRCEKMGVSSEKNLKELLTKEQRLIKDLISDDFIISVERDICDFVREIMRIDSRFKGTIVSRNPVFEKCEFFLPETFEFFCELESYHALSEGCISLGKTLKNAKDGESVDILKSTKDQEFFRGSNFKLSFYKAAKQALQNFTFKTLALIPPFFGQSLTGIFIYGLLTNKPRMNLVQIAITPVLKVPSFTDSVLRKRYQNQLQFPGNEHLANTEDSRWIYLSNFTPKHILSALTEDEQMVLWTCLYFRKLLSLCWWLPKKQERRVGCIWQSYPISVDFPTQRLLIFSFLDELVETKDGHWKKENYLDKVVCVLRRCSPPTKRKVSFLSDSPIVNPLTSISAVMAFLEKITVKNGLEPQEDSHNSAPKSFGKFGKTNKAVSKNSLNVELE